jgi:MFS family permease
VPQARGLGLAEVGIMLSIHGIVAAVLEVPSGAVADAIGRRTILLVGAALLAGSLTAFALARGMLLFGTSQALMAAGRAAISGSLEAWFVDARHADDPAAPLRRPLSRASAAGALGLALGALLGGVVPQADLGLAHSGDDLLLIFSPVLLLGAALALVYLVAVATLVRGPGSGPAGGSAERGFLAFREIAMTAGRCVRTSPSVRLLLPIALGIGIAVAAVETLWQPRLSDLLGGAAGSTAVFGVLSAGSMLAAAAGATLAPRLAARVGDEARTLYMLAALGAAGVVAGLALAATPWVFAIVFVGFYAAVGVVEPLHQELLHEAVPSGVRATMLSASSLAEQVGGVVSGLTLARLAQDAGISTAFWVVCGVLVAVALVVRALPRVRTR